MNFRPSIVANFSRDRGLPQIVSAIILSAGSCKQC